MREILARLGEDIHLGRRGENLATCVIFDVSEWQGAGEGMVHLLHQRNGDELPYPCAITVEDGAARWVVTAADVDVAGRGKAELQYLDGEVCIKSAVFTTRTQRALGKAGEAPPEPEEGWVSKVLEAGGSAMASAEAAHRSEANAKNSETNAKQSEDAATQAATSAANSAAGAKASASQAAESRDYAVQAKDALGRFVDDAQTARDAAEKAQREAEAARDDAVQIAGGDFATRAYVDHAVAADIDCGTF